jgi:chromosome segregation ATPase
MAEQDTPTTGETVAPVTSNNTEVPVSGTGADSQAAELTAQLEAERKARTQAEMRARQLENERAEETRKQQEEQGKYQELYEAERKRAAELEQQKELDALMSKYPDSVQATAKKLFGSGDFQSQLEALNEALNAKTAGKTEEEEIPQPRVEPLNPNPRGEAPSLIKTDMSLDDIADALEKRLKGAGL